MPTNLPVRVMTMALVQALALVAMPTAFAYPDTHKEDLVIDAPWRTVRNYLPVLFFAPDFEESAFQRLRSISLDNFDPVTKARELVFTDSRGFSTLNPIKDAFPCAVRFIDSHGRARAPIENSEPIEDFWHYIARVPTSCIGVGAQRGQPGVHYLTGTMHWVQKVNNAQGVLADIPRHDFKVLRVVVTTDGFAKFSPVDHQFDIHVHTIAEQTKWHGLTNPDAARKAFGGPVAMLMESAYALGMVDVQLNSANWPAFKNKIVTTDHNVFFSGPPNDAGTHPGRDGPTSATNGKEGELRWYRENLGELGGEEVTVQGANGDPVGPRKERQGSHLLSYGAPHLEGPWHGGKINIKDLVDGVENHISITDAIMRMGSTDGFGYASHPEDSSIGWSRDYYERSIGLPPFNRGDDNSAILQANGREFVFKGLQVWNEHTGMRSRNSGQLEVSESHRFNAFGAADSPQRFVDKEDWRKGHEKTYEAYKALVKRGLHYAFEDKDEHVFIRKLYLSAGTDAHGDFNQSQSLRSTTETQLSELVNFDLNGLHASANAFGRLRTYTLTSQRFVRAGAEIPPNCPTFPFCAGAHPAPSEFPLADYKEGNTVATDGPVGRFSADANCRFNSDTHRLSWHDQRCVWENHDGLIGGRGVFDGGNTLLSPVGNEGVLLNAQWIGKNDYLADDLGQRGPMVFRFTRINPEVSTIRFDSGAHAAGPARRLHILPLNDALDTPTSIEFPRATALILEGQLGREPLESRFITNPIWSAPYRITVAAPDSCPFKPGELTVTVEFGLSMDTRLPLGNAAQTSPSLVPGAQKFKPFTRQAAVGRRLPDGQAQPEALVADTLADDEPLYEGIRVHIKPLSSSGNSGAEEYLISGSEARWEPVEVPREFAPRLIQDAKYTTRNRTSIPCAAAWDSGQRRSVRGRAAYAVVVHQIHDMHGNYLNPIGTAFTVANRSGPHGPGREPFDPGPAQVNNPPSPTLASCKAGELKLCSRRGASCELLPAAGSAKLALCRWAKENNARACERSGGIWTTAGSKYARNHPGAVPAGAAASCITEARNLVGRID